MCRSSSTGAVAELAVALEARRGLPTEEEQDPLRALLAASLTGLISGAFVVLLNDAVHLGRGALDSLPSPLSNFGPAISASLLALLALARPLHGQGADLNSLKKAGGWPSADKSMAPLRGVAAALSLAGGNSLGPEGPSVEIGANVGAAIGASMLSERPEPGSVAKVAGTTAPKFQWNLLAAGCASGIAAGFNAPVAGLFYSLEALGRRSPGAAEGKAGKAADSMNALGPSMQLLAAVLAGTVSQLGLGSTPAVNLEPVMWAPRDSLWELPIFMLLGACCGLSAAALSTAGKGARRGFDWLQSRGVPSWVFPPAAGLLVSAATFAGCNEVVYRGFDNVNYVINQIDGVVPPATRHPLEHFFALLVTKALLTAVCQASGLVGGLFAPALFMGVSLGGIFGRGLRDYAWSVPLLLGDIHAFSVPATYSVVGMAATLASVCGVPLTSVVLIIELAGGSDYGVVLPTVAAVGTAVYVENRLELWLNSQGTRQGLPTTGEDAGEGLSSLRQGSWVFDPRLLGPQAVLRNGAAAGGPTKTRVVRVDPTSSVGDLLQQLRGSSDPVAVVVGQGAGEGGDEEATVAFVSGVEPAGLPATPCTMAVRLASEEEAAAAANSRSGSSS